MKRGRTPAAIALPALRDAAAAASVGSAAEAAHMALAGGGSAVDAVVAGFLAAAGTDPSVLLGSASALVAMAGSSVRAFDGRPLQPGKGAQRPRGLQEGAPVPDAARIAVPRAIPMLQLLHAYGGRSGLSTLGKLGADAALAAGAKERAKVLRRVGAAGVIGLRTEGVHEALLAAGNSVAGGALTEVDLDGVLPADADALVVRSRDDGFVAGVPWAEEGASDVALGWVVDVVVAADSRGGVAALSFAHHAGRGAAAVGGAGGAAGGGAGAQGRDARDAGGGAAGAGADRGRAVRARPCLWVWARGGLGAGEMARFDGPLAVDALLSLGEGGAVETALGALAREHHAARGVAAVRAPKATRAVVVVADAVPEAAP
jgi:hypothetical protein